MEAESLGQPVLVIKNVDDNSYFVDIERGLSDVGEVRFTKHVKDARTWFGDQELMGYLTELRGFSRLGNGDRVTRYLDKIPSGWVSIFVDSETFQEVPGWSAHQLSNLDTHIAVISSAGRYGVNVKSVMLATHKPPGLTNRSTKKFKYSLVFSRLNPKLKWRTLVLDREADEVHAFCRQYEGTIFRIFQQKRGLCVLLDDIDTATQMLLSYSGELDCVLIDNTEINDVGE